mmetsp:Transcript_30847/g.77887  ORF Transcript_30847/g.77887 Transcript_30847/m.77887 type:complete len:264 (+) Transcript_30847:973-1764(+)
MAQHIKAASGRDRCGHARRVVGVHDAERRLEQPAANARLGAKGCVVKDGHPRGLRPRAGCGGHRDERLDGRGGGHREARPHRRVHKVQEGRVGLRCIQVHHLRGVHGGAAADGNVRIKAAAPRKGDGRAQGHVRRFHRHLVEQSVRDARRLNGLQRSLHGEKRCHVGVGDDTRVARAEVAQVRAHLPRGAYAVADVGGRHLKGVLVAAIPTAATSLLRQQPRATAARQQPSAAVAGAGRRVRAYSTEEPRRGGGRAAAAAGHG